MVAVKIGDEFLVNSAVANGQSFPTITGLAGGGFVVSWEDFSEGVGGAGGDSSLFAIKAQIYNAAGARVGGEFLVNSAVSSYQVEPAITGLANGGFVVSWTDLSRSNGGAGGDSSSFAIKAQIYDAAGARVGGEFLVNSAVANNQAKSAITGLANGGFVISWTDSSQGVGGASGDSSSFAIKAQMYDAAGARVGGEFLVNSAVTDDQLEPTITGLANGGFVVSWYDFSKTLGDVSGYSIKAQLFAANGSKVGTEFLVNTQTANGQLYPTITGLVDGGFVVSWYDGSGTLGDADGSSIKAQVFAVNGAKIGSEFLVNTQTGDFQQNPTIAGLADGGFVVGWSDNSGTLGDSSLGSVKAQIFAADGAKIGSEFLVNSAVAGAQQSPTITGLADGGFVVSWEDNSAGNGGAGGDSSGSAIKAQIFSVDNAAPVIGSNGGSDAAAIMVDENATAVTTVTATDPDSGDILGYAITGGADAALFGIDEATGALAFLAAPDFEAPADAGGDNVYDVIVSVSDGELSDTQALAITVANALEGNIITGTEANDAINTKKAPVGQPKATALDDVIFGNGGNDTIDGGAGADQMHGGLGNDTFMIDDSGDTVVELAGEGIDTMKARLVDLVLAANIEKGTLIQSALNLAITGNDLANTLTGNGGANVISGGNGNDKLSGSDGDDTLLGGEGDDKLKGGFGFDDLQGGNGNDLLDGGLFWDSMTGGAGADRFKFGKNDFGGRSPGDTITDFSGFGGEGDRIDLAAQDANNNSLDGNQKFVFLGTGAFSDVAGQLRYEQSGGDTVIFGDVVGAGFANFQIVLVGLHNLVAADFIL